MPGVVERGDCVLCLYRRRHRAPRRVQRTVPAVAHRPDRPGAQPSVDQRAPDQGGAAEVERLHLLTGLHRAAAKAKGLHGHRVKKGGGAGGDHPLQKVDFVDGEMAAICGGGQRGGQDHSVGVSVAHSRGDGAQHLCIGDRIDVARAPVRGNVGFIPKLIVADVVAVTLRKGGGEAGKIGEVGGRRQVVAGRGILRRQCPIRRGVEHGDRRQPSGGDGCHQPICLSPVEAPGRGFDRAPVEVMAHPAKASRTQLGKASIDESCRTSGQLHGDAGKGRRGAGRIWGWQRAVQPDAGLQRRPPQQSGRQQPETGQRVERQQAQLRLVWAKPPKCV